MIVSVNRVHFSKMDFLYEVSIRVYSGTVPYRRHFYDLDKARQHVYSMKTYNEFGTRTQRPIARVYDVGIIPKTRAPSESLGEVRIHRIPLCDSMSFEQMATNYHRRRMPLFELPIEKHQIFELFESIGPHQSTTESELKELIETERMKTQECVPLLNEVLGNDVAELVINYISIQVDFETLSTQLQEMSIFSGVLETNNYDLSGSLVDDSLLLIVDNRSVELDKALSVSDDLSLSPTGSVSSLAYA